MTGALYGNQEDNICCFYGYEFLFMPKLSKKSRKAIRFFTRCLQATAVKSDKEEYLDKGLIYSNDSIYIRAFDIKWLTYSGEPSKYKVYYVFAKNWEGRFFELYKRDVWFEKYLNGYIDGLMDSEKDKNKAEAMWSMAISVGEEKK